MPGSYDANGIYIYNEDDLVSPFSDFLNLLAYSASDAVGDLKDSTDARLDVLEAGTGTVPTVTTYTASTTWNKPAHLLAVRVRCIGGGGAGGGAGVTAAGQQSGGGGGGGGAYAESWIPAASLPASVAVTAGTAGVGAAGAPGGDGGPSSFGAFVVAAGGSGGAFSAAGTADFNAGGGAGGLGGSSVGQLRVAGDAGGRCYGFPASGVLVSAALGGGGALATGGQMPGYSATGSAGSIGGGGAGSSNRASLAAARPGGNGGVGFVIVEHIYKVV